MDGSATLTIVASSTTMNCATQTMTRMNQRLTGALMSVPTFPNGLDDPVRVAVTGLLGSVHLAGRRASEDGG